jgi:hypothetical protein
MGLTPYPFHAVTRSLRLSGVSPGNRQVPTFVSGIPCVRISFT